jgi:hypothetical protein
VEGFESVPRHHCDVARHREHMSHDIVAWPTQHSGCERRAAEGIPTLAADRHDQLVRAGALPLREPDAASIARDLMWRRPVSAR